MRTFLSLNFQKLIVPEKKGREKNHILIWILGWMSLANGCKNGFTAQFNIQLPQPTAAFYNIWAVYFFQNLTNVCRLSTGFWRWQRPWWLLLRRQRPRWLLLRRRRRTWRRSGHRGRRPLHIRVEWLNKSLYLKKNHWDSNNEIFFFENLQVSSCCFKKHFKEQKNFNIQIF